MANYWKEKVLPKIKKVFAGDGKKVAAAEACKSFDESKEEINKEFEEKKAELGPKVLEIYEASTTQIKTLVKKPTNPGLKKNSAGVVKFFEELVKIEFPGSKPVSENITKFGPVLVSGPVLFIFEKVVTFIPVEEPAPAEVETREITVEEIKKEEQAEAPAEAEPAPAAPEAEPEKPAEPEPSPAPEPEKPAEPAPEPAKA